MLWVGIGITASVLLPLEAIYFAQAPFVDAVYQLGGMPEPAAVAAYTLVFRNLVAAQQLFAVVGLVFVVGAILAGPNRFATSLRNGFKHGLASIGPDWDFGPFGEWIYVHQSGMRTAGIIAAIAILLLAPAKSIATIIWLVVGVVVWIALVALFGRPRPVKSGVAPTRSRPSRPRSRLSIAAACVAAPCAGRYTRGCTSRRVGVPAPRETRRVVREA